MPPVAKSGDAVVMSRIYKHRVVIIDGLIDGQNSKVCPKSIASCQCSFSYTVLAHLATFYVTTVGGKKTKIKNCRIPEYHGMLE